MTFIGHVNRGEVLGSSILRDPKSACDATSVPVFWKPLNPAPEMQALERWELKGLTVKGQGTDGTRRQHKNDDAHARLCRHHPAVDAGHSLASNAATNGSARRPFADQRQSGFGRGVVDSAPSRADTGKACRGIPQPIGSVCKRGRFGRGPRDRAEHSDADSALLHGR